MSISVPGQRQAENLSNQIENQKQRNWSQEANPNTIQNFKRQIDNSIEAAMYNLRQFAGDELGDKKEQIIQAVKTGLKPNDSTAIFYALDNPNMYRVGTVLEQTTELYSKLSRIMKIGEETADNLVDTAFGPFDGGVFDEEDVDEIADAILNNLYVQDEGDTTEIAEANKKNNPWNLSGNIRTAIRNVRCRNQVLEDALHG